MKPIQRSTLKLIILVFFISGAIHPVFGQAGNNDGLPPADIAIDEGGPVVITGTVAYTNAFFTAGVASPLIILEDQAGFVDRNRYFIMPVESQTIGQITSDFYTSPFSYSLALPIVPRGTYRDVDQNGVEDIGVQIFAVAYWANVYGDPFLEERDLYGGGWSSAYASTRVSPNAEDENEIIGGKFLVYAPDDNQGFPSGFGPDGRLFTEDDPIVRLPQGYTVVDMDTDPFTFIRSQEVFAELYEPQQSMLDDFSNLSYAEAFDAMVAMFRTEYAYTEAKNMDWDALHAEFRPRFEAANSRRDSVAYMTALRDFYYRIPDGHMTFPIYPQIAAQYRAETDGGLGMGIRETDDGRVIVTYLTPNGPAERAGFQLGTEIVEIDGQPVLNHVAETSTWEGPYSSPHVERLQQLRYAVRFALNTSVSMRYRNPGTADTQTIALTTVNERDSFTATSFRSGLTGFEQPLEYRILDNGYGYVKIYSFLDNQLLTIQLWERLMQALNDADVPGLIIDMRQNGGGWGFTADQMAAYFFDEALEVGITGRYDDQVGDFYFDPRGVRRFYLPAENLRYHGPVAVLVAPSCSSACEFFTHDMTLQDRAAIVGMYPTGGLGGGQEAFVMPEGVRLQFSVARNVDLDGNILIEGTGIAPTVRVPVTEETLLYDGDVILDYAIAYLDEATTAPPLTVVDGGAIALGSTVAGELVPGRRVRYMLANTQQGFQDWAITTTIPVTLRVYVGNNPDPVIETSQQTITSIEIPPGLTLIFEIGGARDVRTGSFTFTIQETGAAVPGIITNGGEVAVGDAVEGTLAVGERIQYTLIVPEDMLLDFMITQASGQLDTVLRIYLPGSETPIFENDDFGTSLNSGLTEIGVRSGLTLIIEVGGFSDTSSGDFTLVIQETPEE